MVMARLIVTARQALRATGMPALTNAPSEQASIQAASQHRSSCNTRPVRISSTSGSARRVSIRVIGAGGQPLAPVTD
jgi:hypothetical protein